ncbi:hypothetical protein WALSEDRAFT_57461 [Wallemia mellicola CBS 633.66]|uniref:Uncharacterized protein n=3 Tax=Wallemia mellicola TaxID=1708541 RepID=A0A4T0SHT9_9BASI|nr:hypothetical protein WALSEDRAFT_57461 [Wallemia mellicola CBS 633.66]TIB74483.1 hypothetical protein E3Q24_00620 [Wallemia mellicola]EIM21693.1 hypothetical protein WALSEDRAFT_57461 [Wallemia mellicola CBS 633.66]TIB90061.1 hypothetical protein E3Q21_00487 [Wallemia mellicola]TIC51532.1 hypothetical protein E3Q05_03062 [Wallemia mellicola]TIC68430.1 hypothetical protein E3Q01_00919 [Wallemia mellicola]|eukprot:XP_006958379.1 hypothetical protein WALSEDRAFT_57461 [Wallemia mellicola CBS 633.66]
MPANPDTSAAAQALSNLNIALGLESSDLVSLANSIRDLSAQLSQQYNENAETQKENLSILARQSEESQHQLSNTFTATLQQLVHSFEKNNLELLAQNERHHNQMLEQQKILSIEEASRQDRNHSELMSFIRTTHNEQFEFQREQLSHDRKLHADTLEAIEHQARLIQQSTQAIKDMDNVNRAVGSRVDDIREDLEVHRSELRRLGDTLREIEQRDMIRTANSAFSVETDDHARIQWPSPLRTPDPDYPALPPTISALKRMPENDLLALSSAHTSVLRSAWIDYGKRGGDLRRELPIRIASSVGFRLGNN